MKRYALALALSASLVACNNTAERAAADYEKALALYEQQDYFAAKSAVDSIRAHYPKEFDVLKQTLTLMRRIELKETERTLAYCDSLLPIKQAELAKLKKAFVLEKDTAYVALGNYIYKQQTIERNVKRCYVRCGVDEKGEMYLASVFYGAGARNHTGIKVSIPKTELEAETPAIPYDGGVNYRFTDMGNTTEVVTYKEGNAQAVIQLIYDNAKERVRIAYTGGKPYVIYMAEADKKSIVATYELAMVLSDIERMTQEKEKATKKRDYLHNKGVQ